MIEKITNNAISEDILFEISRFKIPGFTFVVQPGEILTSGTSLTTIWSPGGIRPYPAAATIMKVSSTSANDTGAGSGARTVRIVGLDSTWKIQDEIITLNGQTGVNTTKEYLRILKMFIATAGATGWNEGDVYIGTGAITAGVPAVIHDMANGTTGDHGNVSLTAAFSVPKGYRLHILSIAFSSDKGTDIRGSVYVRVVGDLFRAACKAFTYQNSFLKEFTAHAVFPEQWDVELRAIAGTSGNIVGEFCGILERVDTSQQFILPNLVLSDSWSF